MITCSECEYLTTWRSGEVAKKYGPGYECRINIISCPNPRVDYCSKAVKIKKCNRCGERFSEYPNFCPNCGMKITESEE